MKNDLTLKKINNTQFDRIYEGFITGKNLSAIEYETILAIAVCFINAENKSVQQFGYRIIVEYCNQTGDYNPLYEISINTGLYPISKYIEDHYIKDNRRNFFTIWNDAFTEMYKSDDIYQSEQQKALVNFSSAHNEETISVVAPTSYGKSELINDIVRAFPGNRICILVPTKALLVETKKRLKVACKDRFKKIVIHPEMYNSEEETCLAVLTQERLLRLFKKNKGLAFDCIVIDEAHELLEDEQRSRILADVIILAQKRNCNVVFKFLTPFLTDSNNLKVRYTTYDINAFSVNEYIKTEKYFIHDLKKAKESVLYDQFLNEFFKIKDLGSGISEEEIVKEESGDKNIVYLNKPQNIEEFALDLASILPDVNSNNINDACKNISNYTHSQYNLIKCLKKGVIYHHGSVPDAIRVYIEELYKNDQDIKYVVTSSTLLAGVNLPADRMFILDYKRGRAKLSPESFRNLVGRVCRFGEIFNNTNSTLKRLEPQIHIVYGKYFSAQSDIKKFIEKVAKINTSLSDPVKNVLLKESSIDTDSQKEELSHATEFIENYENGTVTNYHERYIKTEVGHLCIQNDLTELDIFETEEQMQSIVDQYRLKDYTISNIDNLITSICNIFLNYMPDNSHQYELKSLVHQTMQDFYSKMFCWKTENKTYEEMIVCLIDYWESIYQRDPNTLIFVGKWGDVSYSGHHERYYTYLKNKTYTQKVNLAIVRIKEGQDFIDNTLIKYIETLRDLNLLEEGFYSKIKYGTDDENAICLIKNGLSINLSILLLKKYSSFIDIGIRESTVIIDEQLPDVMSDRHENKILIQELKNNI